MPLNRDAFALDTGRRSVQDARSWVVEACRDLGRDDLTETAELGIAELVSNAILHAAPPIRLRLRGTREHPRVEVIDGSQTPPVPNFRMAEDDELLSTIGRGLGIVAMCANAWGADIQPDGKIVWFEPAGRISDEPTVDGIVYDAAEIDARDALTELRDGVRVALEQLPVALHVDFSRHYQELRRELRLLSLSHETDYPVAKNLSSLFLRFDEELRVSRGTDALDEAIARGDMSADVALLVPRTSPATFAQMIDLLELADAFCRAERLLSLATTPQQQQFQRWFLGEFVRQARGEAPRPWAGSLRVQSLSQSAS